MIYSTNTDSCFCKFTEKSRHAQKFELRYEEAKKKLEEERRENETIRDRTHSMKMELDALKLRLSEKGNNDYEGLFPSLSLFHSSLQLESYSYCTERSKIRETRESYERQLSEQRDNLRRAEDKCNAYHKSLSELQVKEEIRAKSRGG